MEYRGVAILLVVILGLAGEAFSQTVQRFGVLPRRSSPLDHFIQGSDGYLYGAMEDWEDPDLGLHSPAAIYRISPNGQFSYVHQFDYMGWWPRPNIGGGNPTSNFDMGRDGFIYGLTCNGGLTGMGVFYRLSVDGVFEVISSFQDQSMIPVARTKFIEGPDAAWYFIEYRYYGKENRLLRLGLDGTQTEIGDHLPANLIGLFCPAMDKNRLALVSYDYATGSVKIRTVEVPSGITLEEKSFPVFSSKIVTPRTISMDEHKLRFYCLSVDVDQAKPGQIIDLDLDSGKPTLVTEFSFQSLYGAWPLPWDGDEYWLLLSRFPGGLIFDNEGGIFFVASDGWLYYMAPGGGPVQVCNFDGFPIVAMTLGNDHVMYGVSWGEEIVTPEEPAAPASPSDQPSPALVAPIKTAPHANGMPASLQARSAVAPSDPDKLPRYRHGAFRTATKGHVLNLAPIAKIDRITMPRAKTPPGPILVPVLKNDFDPEKEPLSLQCVSPAQFGTASIITDSRGLQKISYSPSVVPAPSENLSYVIADQQGLTATGRLLIRGDVAGTYQSPPTSPDSLTLKVTSKGSFSAIVQTAQPKIRATFSGTLDWSDKATVEKRLKDGSVVLLRIELGATPDQRRKTSFQFEFAGQTVSGEAVRK